MGKFSRRSLIRSGIALAGIAAVGDACWIEPGFLRMTRHKVPIPHAPAGWHCRILHMADFHYEQIMPLSFLRQAVALGLSANPDLIAITGDFVHWKLHEHQEFESFLREIANTKPTFATTGNHDGGAWTRRLGGEKDSSEIRAVIEGSGINSLHNRSAEMNVRGHSLRLVGLGDLWSDEFDPESAFSGSAPDDTAVILSHNPDSKSKLEGYHWNLMLSGHTHGGQVRIPVIGGTPFAPVKDKRYVSGLNPWHDRWIHTTQGVATTCGVRFNCRPEVSVLDLFSSAQDNQPCSPA